MALGFGASVPPRGHGEVLGRLNVNAWTPAALGSSLKVCYEPADRATLYTDFAMTTLAMAEDDAVAAMADKSGNALHAKKLTASARPLLYFLLASCRRALDFDGVDDVLTTVMPALGSACTIARSLPGGGASILVNQTINAGNLNQTLDSAGMVITDRALTPAETASVTTWLNQKAGAADEFNIAYGAGASETLDVYHSSGHAQGPIIVMVHGGGWRNGDKLLSNVIQNKSQNWLPQGYTLVSANYELSVGTSPIDQARSIAKMLAFVQDRAIGWGCDPSKIVLMGHSAGAHLVSLVAASDAIRQQAGVRGWLGTVLLDTAAYNVVAIMSGAHLPLYDEPWGADPAVWAAGSPTLVLSSKPAPMLLVNSTEGGGEADSVNGAEFKAAVESFGGRADWYDTPLLHGEVNDLLGVPGAYTTAVQTFFTSLGL
jgi:acetyl esterase/lipase